MWLYSLPLQGLVICGLLQIVHGTLMGFLAKKKQRCPLSRPPGCDLIHTIQMCAGFKPRAQ